MKQATHKYHPSEITTPACKESLAGNGALMIIQTGQRTDIPAFYSEWFANRLKEGYVLVRNPFNPASVTRYELDPAVVDLIGFCSKNPAPLLKYAELLTPYRQYWFVTITPYGKDIEPYVPEPNYVMQTFKEISNMVGADNIVWRYDPIIVDRSWTLQRHLNVFSSMASALAGYTRICVISFIDLYEKVKCNYPEATKVSKDDQLCLTEAMVKIGKKHDLAIKPCGESKSLEAVGADCSGCMTVSTFESAIGQHLNVPSNPKNRKECACYITGDIGQYNTCGHLCRYCYANADADVVLRNKAAHDPKSPLLIGHLHADDVVHQAKQSSWIDAQMRIEDYFPFYTREQK